MSKLAIRHGFSAANDRNNYGTPTFGHPDAPLMPEGRLMAKELGTRLETNYGLVLNTTPAAVSKMLRAQETAREAGFANLSQYEILNEVDTLLPYPILKAAIKNRELPRLAIQKAEYILESPPQEQVWVTHGLVIAGLCKVLGIDRDFEHFVPKFCEVRELPI